VQTAVVVRRLYSPPIYTSNIEIMRRVQRSDCAGPEVTKFSQKFSTLVRGGIRTHEPLNITGFQTFPYLSILAVFHNHSPPNRALDWISIKAALEPAYLGINGSYLKMV